MTTSPLKVEELIKGQLYVVDYDETWMMGNLAEYHSTYPRSSDGEPLHNMVFRDAGGDLEMTLRLTDEILVIAPGGSRLGDTVTVKGD